MKNGINEGALPALIGDVITDQKHYIDNLFADTWKKLKFNARIKGAGFTKTKRNRDNGSRFSIAALEVDQCVVDSDVFQESTGDVLAGAQRITVRVPVVEITHHRDRFGIRRPHRKQHPCFAMTIAKTRTGFVIQTVMITLLEQVNVMSC